MKTRERGIFWNCFGIILLHFYFNSETVESQTPVGTRQRVLIDGLLSVLTTFAYSTAIRKAGIYSKLSPSRHPCKADTSVVSWSDVIPAKFHLLVVMRDGETGVFL